MRLITQAAFLFTAIAAQTIPNQGDACPVADGSPAGWTISRDSCADCANHCKVEAVALPSGEDTALINCNCVITPPSKGDTCPVAEGNPSGWDIRRDACANCADSCKVEQVALAADAAGESAIIDCGCDSTSETPAPTPVGPKKGDACPIGFDDYTLRNDTCVTGDCYGYQCVITDIEYLSGNNTNGTDAVIGCGCETPKPVEPDCQLAYDDKDYCKCPAPRPSPVYPELLEVSVCGDATYLLPDGVIPCSGPTDKEPAGTGCPKKGVKTKLACREEILSYITGDSSGTCVAPEDAVCEKLNTGAWGCIFPGNCNTVNTCTEQPKCEGDYEKQEDGTCKLGSNGYPVPYENNTALVNTAELTELKQDTRSSGAASTTIAMTVTALFAVSALY